MKKTTAEDKLLGKYLRVIRIKKSLSMEALAANVGVTSQQIYHYEHGVHRLSVSRFLMVCKALDVDPALTLTSVFGAGKDTSLNAGKLEDVTTLIEAFIKMPDPKMRKEVITFARVMSNA